MCWECYSCVKICPTQAIEVRGYADFVPLGASATAMRSTEDIMWTVQFRSKGHQAEAVQVPDPSGRPRRARPSRSITIRPATTT